MRSKIKRTLAILLTAAMTAIPAISSLAAEPFMPEYSPFAPSIEGLDGFNDPAYMYDPSNPYFAGWAFGMASPSDMLPAFMPGIDTTLTDEAAEEEVIDDDAGNYAKLLVYDIQNKASDDELLSAYIDRLFYGEPEDEWMPADYWRSQLSDDEQELYDALKDFTEELAAADEYYPVFDAADFTPTLRLARGQLGLSDTASNTEWYEAALDYYLSDVINVSRVVNCLYRDCPYDFYWAEKSYVVSFSAHIENGRCVIGMTVVYFPVEEDYEGDFAAYAGGYVICNVSTEDIISARMAAEKAWEIVEDHKDESETEMTASFEDEINELITYDNKNDASSSDYDDPWMLVYVFDDDPGTTVTEEAYELALHCLRVMSGLENDDADEEPLLW